jgi:hypothetical protein
MACEVIVGGNSNCVSVGMMLGGEKKSSCGSFLVLGVNY